MKALIFEPHDDDLIISMGGTALKLIENGYALKTVQMTDGRHGSEKIEPEELVKVRREEKNKELDVLEIDAEFLDYEDGKLWDLMQNNSEEVVDKIRKILENFNPDVVFMPARDEGHPDHRATNIIVSRALEVSEIKPLKISYIVWQLPFVQGENLAEKTICIDVENFFERKLEILRLHKSQLDKRSYDEMIRHYNQYLDLLYFSKNDQKGFSEILGIQNPEKIDKLQDLNFKEVSELSHGRSTENISLK